MIFCEVSFSKISKSNIGNKFYAFFKIKPKYIYTGGGSYPPLRESNARIGEIGSPI